MSRPKELNFFVLEKNYSKGCKWYKSLFYGEAKAYGEASTDYTKYPTFKGVPKRMHSVIPQAKLIYLIRNLINRIISHYVHNIITGRERRSIISILSGDLENIHYVNCSKYYMQLKRYLKYYRKEQILVIITEELMDQRHKVMKKVFSFLGVDDSFHSSEYLKTHHVSSTKKSYIIPKSLLYSEAAVRIRQKMPSQVKKKIQKILQYLECPVRPPTLPIALRDKLVSYFSNDIECLKEYLGHDLRCWNL